MKGLFPEYEFVSDERARNAWAKGIFVFDANILLNLYRYQAEARENFLKILSKLSSQIWIPHHVALEFQRNRLRVVAEQIRRFSDVRSAVEKVRVLLTSEVEKLQLKKRHALIDPEPLTTGFEKLVGDYFGKLKSLEEGAPTLSGSDPLLIQIESLFEKKVGEPPKNQSELDALYKDGESRLAKRIPPGFEDVSKDKSSAPEHMHAGLIYRRSLADFLIWRQILSHAKQMNFHDLIFVTDDDKEDWWWRLEANGPKTIGPRPELVGEAARLGGVTTFLMYNPERFLSFAGSALSTAIPEEVLQDVRDVSMHTSTGARTIHRARTRRSMLAWITNQYGAGSLISQGTSDLLVSFEGRRICFELKICRHPDGMNLLVPEAISRAFELVTSKKADECRLVVAFPNREMIPDAKLVAIEASERNLLVHLTIVLGVSPRKPQGGVGAFQKIDEFVV